MLSILPTPLRYSTSTPSLTRLGGSIADSGRRMTSWTLSTRKPALTFSSSKERMMIWLFGRFSTSDNLCLFQKTQWWSEKIGQAYK